MDWLLPVVVVVTHVVSACFAKQLLLRKPAAARSGFELV